MILNTVAPKSVFKLGLKIDMQSLKFFVQLFHVE